MTDIWDELWKEPSATYANWTSKEGDWIRRVRAEGDRLKNTQCPFTSMTVEETLGEQIINLHQVKTCVECIKELQEKADWFDSDRSIQQMISANRKMHRKLEAIRNGGSNLIGGLKVLIEGHPEIEQEIECNDGFSKWTELSFNKPSFEMWLSQLTGVTKQIEKILEDSD